MPSTRTDDLLMVSSRSLESAAERFDEVGTSTRTLTNGVSVTKPQMLTAARLIREAGTCRIDYPRSMASEQERPAFIHREQQTEAGILILSIGILPQQECWIDEDGVVIKPGCPCAGTADEEDCPHE